MRFAVVTDIHGNAPALEAVLKEVDKQGDIKQIYCLGDMIGLGPNTNEVLDMLFARQDVSMITGNHDEAILGLVQETGYPRSHLHLYPHHDWIADRLDSRFVDKLASLPRTIERKVDNYRLLFTHYHMENRKKNIHISDDPFSKIVDETLEQVEQLFSEHHDDLICFGHHHPIHYFSNQQTVFLNPGSLGCYHQPVARYAVVSVDQLGIQVELKKASYDNVEFLKSYEKLKVPDRQFILEAFHGGQLTN